MSWRGGRTLLTYCNSSEFFKNFAKKFYTRSSKNPRKNYKKINSKGTVLIEFAICIPIMVILLFYAHDLVRLYRYQSQTEFVGQQMVNMIQNISQSRANKAITESDFDNIFGAAWLSVYPGKTLYYDGGYEFGHYARTWIYCVKGLSGGKASVIWGRFVNCYMHRGATNPSSLHRGILPMNNRYGDINIVQDVVPSTICKNLKIQEGELKIIVENTIYNRADVSKDRSGKSRTPMQAFGTHITTPKKYVSSEAPAEIDYFPSYVIFTPKPGLFDETAPQ